MIRQRALAWSAVLALVVALQIASLPIRPSAAVAATLAQDTPAGEAGEATDLAVVALHCAEAPAAEALTSFFATGAAPAGCAPAVGVTIDVMENGAPFAGSPFTTDTAGTLGVRVGLGSSVTLREDPRSLPSGYEPLTEEANGVPYANPVQLDSAAAGTAALFVNVPAAVAATLAQGAPAVDAGQPTDLVVAVTPNRTGCDPAYPDERTCIPPGSPLDAPCAITNERNFTVLPPDPRGLDADGDGIGCEPILPRGGTSNNGADVTLYASGDSNLAAPVSSSSLFVASSPGRVGNGVWVLPPDRHRADDWFVRRNRSNNGSLAIVSNPVFIGNGLWRWAGHHRQDNGFWLRHITIGNFTIARSSNGTLAIVSNSVFIGNGLWTLFDHRREDNGFWLNRIIIGNLTIARSGNGSLAIVSNPVFIGNGLWTWTGRHRDDNWLAPGGTTRAHASDVEPLMFNGVLAVESPPIKLAQASNDEQPTLTINGALSVTLPDDLVAPPRDAAVESPPDAAVAPSSDNFVAPAPSDAAVESPPSDAAVQPPPDTDVAPLPIDNSVAPPPDAAVAPPPSDGYVAPAPSDSYVAPPPDAAVIPPADSVQPPDAAVAPPSDNFVAPPPDVAVAPPSDAGVPDPVYVAPDPVYIAPDPVYIAPDPVYIAPDPVYIAPDPVNVGPGVDPGNVMPDPITVGPGNGDSGNGGFANIAPDPVYVAPDNGAPDLGIAPGSGDFGNGAPDPVNVAPGNGDFGVDPGNVGRGNGDSGNIMPDPMSGGSGNGDSGSGDFGNVAPDLDVGRGGRGGEDE